MKYPHCIVGFYSRFLSFWWIFPVSCILKSICTICFGSSYPILKCLMANTVLLRLRFLTCWAALPTHSALMISVRQAGDLSPASFRFPVTRDTLAPPIFFPLSGGFGTFTLWNMRPLGAQMSTTIKPFWLFFEIADQRASFVLQFYYMVLSFFKFCYILRLNIVVWYDRIGKHIVYYCNWNST